MSQIIQYIGVDLGAESGRVMLGTFDGEKIWLEESRRFPTGAYEVQDELRWEYPRLLSEIKEGIKEAFRLSSGEIRSIGVDTWGVDFGLIGDNGELLELPYHYRDKKNEGMLEKAFEIMPKRDIYENSGLQFMQFNTLYQLLSLNQNRPKILEKSKKLIFMADLIMYDLTGEIFAEYSLASTSGIMDMRTGQWSDEILSRMGISKDILPEIVKPGIIVGKLKKEIANELGCGQIRVVASGSHDTAAAVAAVPARDDVNWAYLSSGTWSLMGVETPKAIVNDKTYEIGMTNEGGVEGTIRLLKNIMGLWLIQECMRHWEKAGEKISYEEVDVLAAKSEPFGCYVNSEFEEFFLPGMMPEKLNAFLRKTNQKSISCKGEIIRAMNEALAFRYKEVLGWLEDVTGNSIDVLNIVGGGIQNKLLCQLTANATGKKVVAGPIEATVIGNIIMQAIGMGDIKNLGEGRKIIRNSFTIDCYEPMDVEIWNEQYKKYKKVLGV